MDVCNQLEMGPLRGGDCPFRALQREHRRHVPDVGSRSQILPKLTVHVHYFQERNSWRLRRDIPLAEPRGPAFAMRQPFMRCLERVQRPINVLSRVRFELDRVTCDEN